MYKLSLMVSRLTSEEQLAFDNYSSWLEFHAELVQRRKDNGLTQTELAKRLGITQPAVSQIESMDFTPSIGTILNYAQALGVRVNFSILAS